jgi:hypothetical protein
MAHEARAFIAFKGEDEGALKGLRLLAKNPNHKDIKI